MRMLSNKTKGGGSVSPNRRTLSYCDRVSADGDLRGCSAALDWASKTGMRIFVTGLDVVKIVQPRVELLIG